MKHPLLYRPEIDGLRAIAVLSVIFYHADLVLFGYTPFKGGFIGVDIFFVISGYLITSIILADLYVGNFSFKKFYVRRIRRIIPVLFIVMVFAVIFSWLYIFPLEIYKFAYSLLS